MKSVQIFEIENNINDLHEALKSLKHVQLCMWYAEIAAAEAETIGGILRCARLLRTIVIGVPQKPHFQLHCEAGQQSLEL